MYYDFDLFSRGIKDNEFDIDNDEIPLSKS